MSKFLLIDGSYSTVEVTIPDCTELLRKIKPEDIKKNKNRRELGLSITKFLEENGDMNRRKYYGGAKQNGNVKN